ncbi:MAG: ABC transporter permease [Deltaproteobacteria bacterium]|nr:ABC transporter permease [Deltaproteobacteria bacterium]
MKNYILRRLLLIPVTLFGITFLTFLIMKLAPGDPQMLKLMFAPEGMNPDALAALLKSKEPVLELPEAYLSFTQSLSESIHGAALSPESLHDQSTYKALESLGRNAVFYAKWLKGFLTFDLGLSSKDRLPVAQKIKNALPITLLINFLSIGLIYLISIPLGIWSALNKDSVLDKVVMVKLFILYSLPSFWVAMMLLTYLAGGEYLNLFPLIGYRSDYYEELSFLGKVLDMAWHLVLPVTVSTIGGFAFLTRFARSNFLDVISQDYIRTARAKGLPRAKVLFKHGLRNALIPFVTLMGTLLPSMLGGSVIIEQIFNIPGMGMLSFEAVLQRDHNVIMAIASISATLTLVGILISDLLYVVVDPRIKLE